MVRDGASPEQARSQVWLVDKQGLLTSDMVDLRDYQQPYARDPSEVKGWAADGAPITLLDAVRHVKPTILLGTSTAAEIASMTGTAYRTTPNKFAAQGTLDAMVRARFASRRRPSPLFKIANDLRWLVAAGLLTGSGLRSSYRRCRGSGSCPMR